jgi:acyl-CoA thioester hydrolase
VSPDSPEKPKKVVSYEFRLRRRVEFSETDMAGIVHYSNFFRYMESAEHAFLRSLGLSVVMEGTDPPVGWPRVHAECDYVAPLRFEDEIEIHLVVLERSKKSIAYGFRMSKRMGEDWKVVATGGLTVVCVTRDSHGQMVSYPIPPLLAEKIAVAPEDVRAASPSVEKGEAER